MSIDNLKKIRLKAARTVDPKARIVIRDLVNHLEGMEERLLIAEAKISDLGGMVGSASSDDLENNWH